MFSLVTAHEAFDEAGNLKDPKLAARLERIVASFVGRARRMTGDAV